MKKRNGNKPIFILTIVLAVLLAMTATALAGTVLYKQSGQTDITPSVTEKNIITADRAVTQSQTQTASEGPTVVEQQQGEETVLKLYRRHAEDSTPFQARNLFPGDSELHPYILQVSYKGTVTVNFHAQVQEGYEKLAEILKCTVSIRDGEVLYDGLMSEMPQALQYELPQSSGETAELIYDITAYLETSVGNEYMEQELYADFRWWVEEDASGQTDPSDSDSDGDPDHQTKPDTGSLIAPQTGDSSRLLLWASLTAGAALLLALWLLFGGRRKKEGSIDEG